MTSNNHKMLIKIPFQTNEAFIIIKKTKKFTQ